MPLEHLPSYLGFFSLRMARGYEDVQDTSMRTGLAIVILAQCVASLGWGQLAK